MAVPLLALAGSWEVAAALIIIERMEKGLRVHSRDVMGRVHFYGVLTVNWLSP